MVQQQRPHSKNVSNNENQTDQLIVWSHWWHRAFLNARTQSGGISRSIFNVNNLILRTSDRAEAILDLMILITII